MTAPLVATAPGNVDTMALSLATLAATLRAMPPSWQQAKDTILIAGSHGERLGIGLPGRGLILQQPLKALGITRPIPGVYDRPLVERWAERLGGRERLALLLLAAVGAKFAHGGALESLPLFAGAITSFNDIIAARSAGKGEDFFQVRVTPTGSFQTSQWNHMLSATGIPDAYTFQTGLAAVAPDNSYTGSLLNAFSKPSGGDKSYLLGLGFINTTIATQALMIADLLYECGGLVVNTTSPQTPGTAALTRYTSGAGVMACLTPTTPLSNTTTTLTLGYTNQGGTGSRSTTFSHINTTNYGGIGRILPANGPPMARLQAGDYGIKSVDSVTVNTTIAAGVLSVLLHKPLVMVPGATTDIYLEREMTSSLDGLLELPVTSGGELPFLFAFMLANTSTSSNTFTLQTWLRSVRG